VIHQTDSMIQKLVDAPGGRSAESPVQPRISEIRDQSGWSNLDSQAQLQEEPTEISDVS
jgi:hypothetical protein